MQTQNSIHPKLNITILGAGVVGLTNAIRLAQAGHTVRIIYNLAREKITSWAAAAFWLPVLSGKDPRIPKMAAESLKVFQELSKNPATGVRPIRLHVAYTEAPNDNDDDGLAWLQSVPTRPLEAHELPVGCSFGFESNVFRMQMERYLPFLEERARWLGVDFEHRTVKSLANLSGDLVLNCTGIYAYHMAHDALVKPIRGQVVLVQTPFELLDPNKRNFDVLIIEGPGVLDYIVFRDNDVLLGGTADEGDWNWAPRSEQTKQIIENCSKVYPELKSAPVLGERVGLRPFRPMIRSEIEYVTGGPVILHSYGHGGSGVTLSWGQADFVQAIAEQLWLKQNERNYIVKQRLPKAA